MRSKCEEKRGDHIKNLRDDENATTIIDISEVTRGKRKQQERCNLNQADITQNDRGPRCDVQVPADGDRQHLQTEARQEIAREKKTEAAGTKGGVSVQPPIIERPHLRAFLKRKAHDPQSCTL